jgi:hypothetical protein
MKNQVKLRKYLFVLLFVLINSLLFAQISRQQAIDHVLDNIVASDTVNVDVFSYYGQLTGQDSIELSGSESIACPFTDSWVFFIDDSPSANWCHPCRYLFINAITGEDSIFTKRIHPVNWESGYEIVNQAFQHGGV